MPELITIGYPRQNGRSSLVDVAVKLDIDLTQWQAALLRAIEATESLACAVRRTGVPVDQLIGWAADPRARRRRIIEQRRIHHAMLIRERRAARRARRARRRRG